MKRLELVVLGLLVSLPGGASGQELTPAVPPQQGQLADPSAGQWVYTQQYGWIWIPYSDSYSYVPPGGEGEPYEYVFEPDLGWCWLAAPWVWGYGPWPYFGPYGPGHFGWYGHGWWRTPGLWSYRPSHAFAGRSFGLPAGRGHLGGLTAGPGRFAIGGPVRSGAGFGPGRGGFGGGAGFGRDGGGLGRGGGGFAAGGGHGGGFGGDLAAGHGGGGGHR
ncbi:MAG TPA: hypothetical protein VMK12_09305 [Anaeromyxobacteraceae bacterium]|nr:hypothetical protein [Anaeromyxobacteraceae bacterium]